MKVLMNLTTSSDDVNRFANQQELLNYIKKFDGLELMCFEEDHKNLIPKDRVIGLHMGSFYNWLDFWWQNEAGLLEEFGSKAAFTEHYGGDNPDVLIQHIRRDMAYANSYQVEYMVFHVSNARMEEALTDNYRYSDEQVISATCELINAAFADYQGEALLLFENLWQAGLRFTDPERTQQLMEGIKYPNKSIILDLGHLLHTNTKLRSLTEGLDYIHALLDQHGELCRYIKAIHLQQSLSGAFVEAYRKNMPALKSDPLERSLQVFEYIAKVDQHRPFTEAGIEKLIARINPDYLTFEFISENKAQHQGFLDAQWKALPLSMHPKRV